MTDNEIIKALECCVSNDESKCVDCPSYDTEMDDCHGVPWKSIFDLINRQKAEIERLKKVNDIRLECLGRSRAKAKAEAIKEFAESVKEEIYKALDNNYRVRQQRLNKTICLKNDEIINYCNGKIDCLNGLDDFIDNLVKEMVGDNNV